MKNVIALEASIKAHITVPDTEVSSTEISEVVRQFQTWAASAHPHLVISDTTITNIDILHANQI